VTSFRALLVVVCLAARVALGQGAEHCDRNLEVSREDPFGYRMRVDRCEGVYVQQVSSTPLVVASFGTLDLPETFGAGGALVVEWAKQAGSIRLRAQSLKPRTYYRMDRQQRGNVSSYRWPTDVLAALKLTQRDIGVVAFTGSIYVPVRIGKRGARPYELVIIPGSELAEVFVAVSRVNGDTRTEVAPAQPLRRGFYPAGRAVRIPVNRPAQPGTYVIEIGATLRDGGAVSREVWFVE